MLSDHLNCSLLISLNQIDEARAMLELASMESDAEAGGGMELISLTSHRESRKAPSLQFQISR